MTRIIRLTLDEQWQATEALRGAVKREERARDTTALQAEAFRARESNLPPDRRAPAELRESIECAYADSIDRSNERIRMGGALLMKLGRPLAKGNHAFNVFETEQIVYALKNRRKSLEDSIHTLTQTEHEPSELIELFCEEINIIRGLIESLGQYIQDLEDDARKETET